MGITLVKGIIEYINLRLIIVESGVRGYHMEKGR